MTQMPTISPIHLLKRYKDVRSLTDKLCEPLEFDDYIPQPVAHASPPKWHLAHVTWFFEEMILSKYSDSYEVFDTSFNYYFNSYYQAVGERVKRDQRGAMTRPILQRVLAYRQYVDQHMDSFISNCDKPEILKLIELGLNHEQQHQELLLTDLKHTFSLNPLYPVYKENGLINDHNVEEGWLSMSEGIYDIGFDGEGFSFDNEQGRHKQYLNAYEISKAYVTNGDYIEFIESGAYDQFEYWLDDAWTWLGDTAIKAPLYWIEKDGVWHHYTLGGFSPIDPDAILCHVSYYEANAFATWKGCRLPTEFEWEAAAPQLEWGRRWEWTNSAYLPYPDFVIDEGAVGEYNGKFMINQMVLRGGSVATSPGHSRLSYRNFFSPPLRWQFTGIRLSRNL